ncbi:MAG: hypothetical protein AB9917_11295 [Negativicutes bacterium]
MGSRKNRLNNEVQRRQQAVITATQAEVERKSLSVNVATVLANNAAAHQEMSFTLRKSLTDFNSGLRKDTAGLMAAIAAAYRVMCAQLSAAMDAAEKNRLLSEKNRLQVAIADHLQLRDYNSSMQKSTAELLKSFIHSHHEMSESLRKILAEHTNELHKDTAEMLISFTLSRKEMGLLLRKELADFNSGLHKDTAELMAAIAAAHQVMCAQLSAAMDAAEKNRLQSEKNRLQETAAEILQRREYLFELLDLDCGARTDPIIMAPTKTESTSTTLPPDKIVISTSEKPFMAPVAHDDVVDTGSAAVTIVDPVPINVPAPVFVKSDSIIMAPTKTESTSTTLPPDKIVISTSEKPFMAPVAHDDVVDTGSAAVTIVDPVPINVPAPVFVKSDTPELVKVVPTSLTPAKPVVSAAAKPKSNIKTSKAQVKTHFK